MDDVCGLWDAGSAWVVSGGHYYLGKAVPLYTRDFLPPSLDTVNYVITGEPIRGAFGNRYTWKKVASVQEFQLYRRDGACVADPNYSDQRYIPAVEALLKAR